MSVRAGIGAPSVSGAMLRLSSNTKSSLHTAPAKLVDYNKYIAPRKSHLLPRAPPTVGSAPINGGMGRRPRLGQTPVSECKMSVIDFLNRLYSPHLVTLICPTKYKMSTSAFVFLQSSTSGIQNAHWLY